MKYVAEMGSVAVIYIPSFIKIGLESQKGKFTDTNSMEIA
jgi:hypothetical protein